jgi:hypothetical protein
MWIWEWPFGCEERVLVYKEYKTKTLLTHPDAWQSYQRWGRFGYPEIQTEPKPKSLKPNRTETERYFTTLARNRTEPNRRIFKISSELHNYLIFMSIFSYSSKRLSFNLASIIKHSVSECSSIIKDLQKERGVR